MTKIQDLTKDLTKALTDEGKLIEAGWVGFRLAVVHTDAPKDQVDAMRMAFFAGAQHLYASMMTIMGDDVEPTDTDIKRMELIHTELDEFLKEMIKRAGLETVR